MEQTETKVKKPKLNTRWRKHAVRYTNERMIDDTRWVKKGGFFRRESDSVGEILFIERRHEDHSLWFRGARVRKH